MKRHPCAAALLTVSLLTASLLTVWATTARAEAPKVEVTPIIRTDRTWAGQPIRLPDHDPTVTASAYVIPAGAVMPVHLHRFPRWSYILSGHVKFISDKTGRTEILNPGDFLVEPTDQWHHAVNPGPDPVRVLVIDITPGVQRNMVMRQPGSGKPDAGALGR